MQKHTPTICQTYERGMQRCQLGALRPPDVADDLAGAPAQRGHRPVAAVSEVANEPADPRQRARAEETQLVAPPASPRARRATSQVRQVIAAPVRPPRARSRVPMRKE